MASTINLLRLLADPTRLRLLLLLEQEDLSVAELQQILGMGQSRISSHLAQLKRAGVVADRRVGKNVYYGANHSGQKAKRERVAEMTRLLAPELIEGSRDRVCLGLACGIVRRRAGTIEIGLHRDLTDARTDAQSHPAAVDEDPGEPGIEPIRLAQSRQIAPRRPARVLGRVASVGLVAEDRPRRPVEAIQPFADDRFVG